MTGRWPFGFCKRVYSRVLPPDGYALQNDFMLWQTKLIINALSKSHSRRPPPDGCCPFPPLCPLEWVVITTWAKYLSTTGCFLLTNNQYWSFGNYRRTPIDNFHHVELSTGRPGGRLVTKKPDRRPRTSELPSIHLDRMGHCISNLYHTSSFQHSNCCS